MKKIFLIIILFIISIYSYADEDIAKIFFINFSGEYRDAILGTKDVTVFTMTKLAPRNATLLLKTNKFGNYKLLTKKSSDKEWNTMIMLKNCKVEQGKIYCIFIEADGYNRYFTLTEPDTNNPRVCFVNGTGKELAKIKIGKEWSDNIGAYAKNLKKNKLTNFVKVPADNYSLFWQFSDQDDKTTYFYFPDKSGKKKRILKLKNNEYYIFMIYEDNNVIYSNMILITSGK